MCQIPQIKEKGYNLITKRGGEKQYEPFVLFFGDKDPYRIKKVTIYRSGYSANLASNSYYLSQIEGCSFTDLDIAIKCLNLAIDRHVSGIKKQYNDKIVSTEKVIL